MHFTNLQARFQPVDDVVLPILVGASVEDDDNVDVDKLEMIVHREAPGSMTFRVVGSAQVKYTLEFDSR